MQDPVERGVTPLGKKKVYCAMIRKQPHLQKESVMAVIPNIQKGKGSRVELL